MRELKFRAWDRNREAMCFDVNVYSDEESTWWVADWLDETGNRIESFDSSGGIIMQATGLVDDHGKYLFEGDIISRPVAPTKWNRIHFDVNERKLVLSSIKAGECEMGFYEVFCPGNKWHPCYEVVRLCDSEFEIVGNIYETPELAQRGDDER